PPVARSPRTIASKPYRPRTGNGNTSRKIRGGRAHGPVSTSRPVAKGYRPRCTQDRADRHRPGTGRLSLRPFPEAALPSLDAPESGQGIAPRTPTPRPRGQDADASTRYGPTADRLSGADRGQ